MKFFLILFFNFLLKVMCEIIFLYLVFRFSKLFFDVVGIKFFGEVYVLLVLEYLR